MLEEPASAPGSKRPAGAVKILATLATSWPPQLHRRLELLRGERDPRSRSGPSSCAGDCPSPTPEPRPAPGPGGTRCPAGFGAAGCLATVGRGGGG
eukprot:403565-Pyramimonas_sp.AAC.1